MRIKTKITLSFVLLLSNLLGLEATAQKVELKILSKFKNADSVVLASHISLIRRISDELLVPYQIVNKNVVNKTPLVEIFRILPIEADSLVKILIEINEDSLINEIKCFDPHHIILIYKNKKCSFIDICFGCRNFVTSKDIHLSDGLSDETWLKLFRFFRNRKLYYELNGETIERD